MSKNLRNALEAPPLRKIGHGSRHPLTYSVYGKIHNRVDLITLILSRPEFTRNWYLANLSKHDVKVFKK